jgi:hypothetical protein
MEGDQHMDTGNHPRPASNNKPRMQPLTGVRKAASWLGRAVVGQVIAHFVRNWLS